MSNLDWDKLSRKVSVLAGSKRQETVIRRARAQAERTPDEYAIIDDVSALTYSEVLAEAESLAASMWDLGLRPGDVVSFQLPNWYETAVINLASCLLGVVCNPIVPIYRDSEVSMILADCRSSAWFIPGEWRNFDYGAMARRLSSRLPRPPAVIRVRDPDTASNDLCYETLVSSGRSISFEPPIVEPDAVKVIMYTSGTTGRAKGVLHSHESLMAPVSRAIRRWGLRPGDKMLMPSPVAHITGFSCGIEVPFQLGMPLILMERWDARDAANLIDEYQANATVGATPFLQELLDEAIERKNSFPSLKAFACGGAAVPPELIRRANKILNGRVFRVYGSTEAPLVTFGISYEDSSEIAATTDGRINEYEVRVRAPVSYNSQGSGEEGEILVRGPGQFLGYSSLEQTKESLTEDGFFCTGDIGILRPDYSLKITGRKKDMIIRGGENISPKEIEDVLHQSSDIVEAAVVAMPHERLGETVCAYVIPRPGSRLTLDRICSIIMDSGLARQKCPEHLEVVADLPRTPSGKVQKEKLRTIIAGKLNASCGASPDCTQTNRDD